MSEIQNGNGSAKTKAVVGLNDNLVFLGKQLHVQTEHLVLPAPRIVTQVFSNGRVLLSRKTDCPADAGAPRDGEEIRRRMQAQHLQVIREIEAKRERVLNSR